MRESRTESWELFVLPLFQTTTIVQEYYNHVEGLYLDIFRILAPYFHSSMGAGTNAKARKPSSDVAHWVCEVSLAVNRTQGFTRTYTKFIVHRHGEQRESTAEE